MLLVNIGCRDLYRTQGINFLVLDGKVRSWDRSQRPGHQTMVGGIGDCLQQCQASGPPPHGQKQQHQACYSHPSHSF